MISGFAFVPQILDAMNQDSRVPLAQLQVDGGMTSNRLLMQLQADILGVTVGESMHTCRRRAEPDGTNAPF